MERCRFPETAVAIAYETQGLFELAQESYEKVSLTFFKGIAIIFSSFPKKGHFFIISEKRNISRALP